MIDKDYSPRKTDAWRQLESEAERAHQCSIIELFDGDSTRASTFSLNAGGLFLDYSKNLIGNQTWQALLNLAEQSPLISHRAAMFAGQAINTTENRAVLHTALRAEPEDANTDDERQRTALVKQQLQAVKNVSDRIRCGDWLGSTGKAITDVVNIGIGGSDLGPKLACSALEEFSHPHIQVHFVANVDGAEILSTLKKLNPETTLVTLASKTFTTQETLLNAKTAIHWFEKTLGLKDAQTSRHFIGLTANTVNALAYGLPADQILEFAEWVGGRYSLWSSIGLSIAISIGFEQFSNLLSGAREMDLHFKQAPMAQNMPIILALVGIWYSNFLDTETIAVIPYCERLLLLPAYLQ